MKLLAGPCPCPEPFGALIVSSSSSTSPGPPQTQIANNSNTYHEGSGLLGVRDALQLVQGILQRLVLLCTHLFALVPDLGLLLAPG